MKPSKKAPEATTNEGVATNGAATTNQEAEQAARTLLITPGSTTHHKEVFHLIDGQTGEHMTTQMCLNAQEARTTFTELFPLAEVKFHDEAGVSHDALVELNNKYMGSAPVVATKDTKKGPVNEPVEEPTDTTVVDASINGPGA